MRAIFAQEYAIFYRRGNYLVEGNSSPINRALILIVSHPINFRDRELLSLELTAHPSLSLAPFVFVLAPRSTFDLVFYLFDSKTCS